MKKLAIRRTQFTNALNALQDALSGAWTSALSLSLKMHTFRSPSTAQVSAKLLGTLSALH
jgi:hypothetical protein